MTRLINYLFLRLFKIINYQKIFYIHSTQTKKFNKERIKNSKGVIIHNNQVSCLIFFVFRINLKIYPVTPNTFSTQRAFRQRYYHPQAEIKT